MSESLQLLFKTIDSIGDEERLRTQVAPTIGSYFQAKRARIFFFNELVLFNNKLQQFPIATLSIDRNPIVRYLVEYHAPVHEELVTTPKIWQAICPRADHWHVMAGPILCSGNLVGAIGCTRDRSMPAFNEQNLADLSGICLHLSVWKSTQIYRHRSSSMDKLTARELQIANLVADGKTNAEIGRELWITENSVKQALKRMFRKLEVTSRAEMVACLANSERFQTSSNIS